MNASALRRFWAKVDRSGECWLWTACCGDNGYGHFHDGDRLRKAHVFSYEVHVGPVPEGLELDHSCRVRHCVNPAHLDPVTHRENSRRAAYSQPTCQKGHPMPEPNARGRRVCRPCANERNARYVSRERAKAIYERVTAS